MSPEMRKILSRVMTLLLALGVLVPSLAACDDDDATAAPLKAFTSPVDGKTYCAWVENPHECPGPPGPPAAPFAMPQDEPRHDPGMSTTDFLLMMALFNWHTSYAPYYGSAGYYNHYVGPAWNGYPGTYYSGPGRTTIRTTNVNVYTDSSGKFDTKYAAQEKANAKNAVYKTANGKVYKGTEVPKKAFSGSNVPVKSGGNANTVDTSKSKSTTSTNTKVKTGTSGSSSGKSSWSTGSSGGSKGSWGSSGSSSRSSGGSSSSSRGK
jgi:hypothetical protein